MPAPTVVSTTFSNAAIIHSTTPRSFNVTGVQVGDRMLVFSAMADNAATVGTPTSTGFTFTAETISGIANCSGAYLWMSSAATTAGTKTITASKSGGSGTFMWALGATLLRGCNGFGVRAKNTPTTGLSGAPTLNITTLDLTAYLFVIVADWNAVSGSSRTWRTGAGALTEVMYDQDTTTSSTMTCYAGYHASPGALGSKTVGLSAPTGQRYSIIAAELAGTPNTGSGFFPFFA